ncbi:MAG: hypothetical protein HN348_25305 [Proteobacteria bacterium]|jgi:hypothetical protein|nr:hypothetical protein [Pseudomonadota bacterium]
MWKSSILTLAAFFSCDGPSMSETNSDTDTTSCDESTIVGKLSHPGLNGDVSDTDDFDGCQLEYRLYLPGDAPVAGRPIIVNLHGSVDVDPSTTNGLEEIRYHVEKRAELWLSEDPTTQILRYERHYDDGAQDSFAVLSVRWIYAEECRTSAWESATLAADSQMYMGDEDLSIAVVRAVADAADRCDLSTDDLMLHGLSRGSARSWVVTAYINDSVHFRADHIDPTNHDIRIALTLADAGQCKDVPCQERICESILGGEGLCTSGPNGETLTSAFVPYSGNADWPDVHNDGSCLCDTSDFWSGEPFVAPWCCPYRYEVMESSAPILESLGATVIDPQLGTYCPADGVEPDQYPESNLMFTCIDDHLDCVALNPTASLDCFDDLSGAPTDFDSLTNEEAQVCLATFYDCDGAIPSEVSDAFSIEELTKLLEANLTDCRGFMDSLEEQSLTYSPDGNGELPEPDDCAHGEIDDDVLEAFFDQYHQITR